MDPVLLGIGALGVGVLGLLVHVWRIIATRNASFAMLWLLLPFGGALAAFMTATPSLVHISLGGASLVLIVVTLLTPLVVPAIWDEKKKAEARNR
jgi:hypothetical protein